MNTEYIMVLDTETTNTIDDPFVYDIGFAIVDTKGNIYETKSFAIADNFLDDELMSYAFFKDKMPMYWDDIKQGKRELITLNQARKIIKDYIKKYNITYVSCHNARFDYNALNTSQRYNTSSRYRFFFPYGVKMLDTLKLSRLVLKDNQNYIDFCIKNNYLTKRNQIRYTAEIIYRFLIGDNNFIEGHQGLDDVLIEKDILNYCLNFCDISQGVLWE